MYQSMYCLPARFWAARAGTDAGALAFFLFHSTPLTARRAFIQIQQARRAILISPKYQQHGEKSLQPVRKSWVIFSPWYEPILLGTNYMSQEKKKMNLYGNYSLRPDLFDALGSF
jgi:hypothetical protein